MPRFCANLTMLFAELPFMERFDAARAAGFDAVEVLFPYDVAVPDMLKVLARNDLPLALINCPPPNYTGGERGFAAVAGSRFRQDFKRSVRYAAALGAQHLHIMAGVAEGPDAKATFIENLRWAAAEAPDQSLTIEPINQDDMPGYFLSDFDLAAEVIAAIDAPNLRLQFDAYHAQKITGDVLGTWARVRDITVHVQVAQTPDRTAPDQSDIDFAAFFAALDTDGYGGWVSGEYTPAARTNQSLGWIV
ncbi:MAG: TIM barrel protein [Yoonia sp.]|jgi:hydroxypyruvate isomerase|nr:TIM barrel protein [Yoonia sp.]